MFFSILFSILAFASPLLFIGAIVGGVIYFMKHKDNPTIFNIRSFLNLYFYIMIYLTIVIGVIGGGLAIKSGLSYIFGTQFSYTLSSVTSSSSQYNYLDSDSVTLGGDCYRGDVITVNGDRYCFSTDLQKRDLITGITLLVSMVLLLAVHVAGLYMNSRIQSSPTIKKLYLFSSLGSYGVLNIVLLPMSIYTLVDYLVNPTVSLTSYGRSIPGEPIAWTILVLPLWIYFLVRVVMLREKKVNLT